MHGKVRESGDTGSQRAGYGKQEDLTLLSMRVLLKLWSENLTTTTATCMRDFNSMPSYQNIPYIILLFS